VRSSLPYVGRRRELLSSGLATAQEPLSEEPLADNPHSSKEAFDGKTLFLEARS
jgi:hypothetical protein